MRFLLFVETFPAVEERKRRKTTTKAWTFIAWIIMAWMHHKTIIKSIKNIELCILNVEFSIEIYFKNLNKHSIIHGFSSVCNFEWKFV